MRKVALVLAVGSLLAGCASVRLEGTVLDQTDCAPTPVVRRSAAPLLELPMLVSSSVASGAASQPEFYAAIPFSAPPMSMETLRTRQRAMLATNERGGAQEIYEALLKQVPYEGHRLLERTTVPLETAAAAHDLYLLIQQVSPPALHADRNFRIALSRKAVDDAPSWPVTEVFGEVMAKSDVNQRLLEVLQAGGDDALLMASAAELALAISNEGPDAWSGLTAVQKSVRARALGEKAAQFESLKFVRTYFKAYFRGGRLFQSELKIDQLTAEALKTIKTQVPLNASQEAALEALLKDKFGKICTAKGDSGCLLNTLGKDKFVTRSGESIQFKGVSLALGYDKGFQATWDYPKSSEFAPQGVRVLNEALFDAIEGRVPAVAAATACTTVPPLFGPLECLTADVIKNYPKLQDIVAAVDEAASRADSLASLATGQIIRGISVAALNNEALAKSAENFAGGLAKKVVERAAWKQSGEGACLISSPAFLVKVVKR